ncbi:hypothetical protein ACFWCB_26205 [Streptomyces sp. NPDC060048]|uniref:hypothetical protein n=1 Tax=unclassified Streptomyces TaxID=2593676 RepID=UPI0036D1D3B7
MITWFRTNRRLRAEVTYLQGRVKAASEARPTLVVRPGPAPAAAPNSEDEADAAELLRGQITALQKLKTTAGAMQLVREARVWRDRAGAHEKQLLALQAAAEATDKELQRITGELTAANARIAKLAWQAELKVGPS